MVALAKRNDSEVRRETGLRQHPARKSRTFSSLRFIQYRSRSAVTGPRSLSGESMNNNFVRAARATAMAVGMISVSIAFAQTTEVTIEAGKSS